MVTIESAAELLDIVLNQERRVDGARVVIAIAGPPASGKSATARRLVDALNDRSPDSAAVFPMDGYHYDDRVLIPRGDRDRKGAPHTFDVAGFANTLARLRRNDEAEVAVPVFDRSIEIARAGARIIPQSVRHLVVEGNYLLLDMAPWHGLADFFDVTVFIDVDEDKISSRLERRWADLTVEQRHRQIDDNDLPNVRLVQSRSRTADVLLRQGR